MNHDHVGTPAVTTTSVFKVYDGPSLSAGHIGNVTVVWTAKGNGRYTGTITYVPLGNPAQVGRIALSAYNIGLQGRRSSVIIDSVTGAKPASIQFYDPVAKQWKDASTLGKFTMDETGWVNAGGGNYPAKSSGVWGIAFEGGTCTLEVVSHRRVHKPMRLFDGHDTTPPPPEPGGQDAEK